MPKRIKHIPNGGIRAEPPALGILELERFSTQDLKKWDEASTGLDELAAELYFGVEAKRRKFRHQLIESIQGVGHTAVPLHKWVRTVTYQYSLEPLTCAGSLQALGGRFNAGYELDVNTMRPWPALYLAQNFETAFREKFQLTSDDLLGELIHDAGFEAILYPSSKGPGKCLAVFPGNLGDASFVQLRDKAASGATVVRLDPNTAATLEGWESIPRQFR